MEKGIKNPWELTKLFARNAQCRKGEKKMKIQIYENFPSQHIKQKKNKNFIPKLLVVIAKFLSNKKNISSYVESSSSRALRRAFSSLRLSFSVSSSCFLVFFSESRAASTLLFISFISENVISQNCYRNGLSQMSYDPHARSSDLYS